MDGSDLIPATPSARFRAVFLAYLRWTLPRQFHAVRLAPGTERALSELNEYDGPGIVLLSHGGWWDPLIGLYLADRFMPRRSGRAPMDAAMLRKFGMFRKLGLFGIEPDRLEAGQAMRRYVAGYFKEEVRPTVWITPQGAFADARSPIVARPGAAALAASHANVRVVSVAIEYGFWLDRKPEVFIRAAKVEAASRSGAASSTTAWQRGITRGMTENAAALARLVMARDASALTLLCGGESKINPVYDLWLRVRGVGRSVETGHRRAASVRGGGIQAGSSNERMSAP